MSDSAEEPKLIIDEDWKTQVQREKEEFERKKKAAESQGAPESSLGSPTDATEPATASIGNSTNDSPTSSQNSNPISSPDGNASSATSSQPKSQALPPASFPMLTTSLGAQAMASMGLLPDEDGQTLPINLDFAKHFIDLLGMLEEKTKSNLSPDESHHLQETLYQLRMTFVEVKKRNRPAATR